MRLRFTIRDLLWLLVVVALAAGWGVYYYRTHATAKANDETRLRLYQLMDQASSLELKWRKLNPEPIED
jgi:hypothetical protein